MRSAVSGSRAHPPMQSRSAAVVASAIQWIARNDFFIGLQASVGHKDVALVAYGPDVSRMLGIGLDLLAQAHDAQVHAAVERIPVAFLAQVQDALARKRAVGLFRERFQ